DDGLALVERTRRRQQHVAEVQRTGHHCHQQSDEEENPTEVAEHASAPDNQTAPKIRQALVPPKPNELLSARRTLRCLACLGTRSMSQPSSGSSRLSV